MKALEMLGHIVTPIDSSILENDSLWSRLRDRAAHCLFRKGLAIHLLDPGNVNNRILQEGTSEARWDLLWLDKPLVVYPETINKFCSTNPDAQVIVYSPDDMFARHNQSAQFLSILPHIDCFITTKSFNVDELKRLGCKIVLFIDNGYDPATHRPLKLEEDDIKKFGGPVGFIGNFESERALFMNFLAENGISVRIWGPKDWKRFKSPHANLRIEYREVLGDNYARAVSAFNINLCFLRKMNRDLQTTRSVEIPACSGFLLAERSSEHLRLFREDKEAAFFSTREELLQKVNYYSKHRQERIKIARAGRMKCINSGYDYASRLKGALEIMESKFR
jgi:hypothetical protein